MPARSRTATRALALVALVGVLLLSGATGAAKAPDPNLPGGAAGTPPPLVPGVPAANATGPLPAYLAAQFDLNTGARTAPSDSPVSTAGGLYNGPGEVVYNPVDQELLVLGPTAIAWYDPANGTVTHFARLSSGGPLGSGGSGYSTPYEVAVDSHDDRAFVTRTFYTTCGSPCAGDTVTVLNASTGALVTTVGGGSVLSGIGYDPANDQVYVADSGLHRLEVLDGRTSAILGYIVVPGQPQNVIFDNTTGALYVTSWTNATNSTVLTVDPANGTVTARTPLTGVGYGFDLALDPTDGHLLVDGASRNVAVLNVSTGRELYYQNGSSAPWFLAWDPLNDRFLVTSLGSYYPGAMQSINASATRAPGVTNLPLSELTTGVAFDPADGRAYVTTTNHPSLYALNGTNLTTPGPIGIGAQSAQLTFDPDNGRVYAGDSQNCELWVENVTNGSALAPLPGLEGGPLAYDSVDRYVLDEGGCSGSANLWEIYGSNDSLAGSLFGTNTGNSPPLVYQAAGDQVWAWTGDVLDFGLANDSFLHSIYDSNGEIWMSLNAPGSLLYVSTNSWTVGGASGRLYSVLTTNGSVPWATPIANPGTNAYDPSDGDVWVENQTGGPIVLVNASNGTVVGNVSFLGNQSGPIVYDPVGPLILAVGGGNQSEMLVYNATSGTMLGTFSTNVPVDQMSVDPTTGHVYFASGSASLGEIGVGNGIRIAGFQASPSSFVLGRSTRLDVNASGGTGAYTYQYRGLPAGCASANTSALTCLPTVSGQFSVNVSATDGNGSTANATVELVVAPPLQLSGFGLAASEVRLGAPVNFTGAASGGIGEYSYTWSGAPRGCTGLLAPPAGCVPTRAGPFNFSLKVEDGVGTVVNATATLVVRAPIQTTLVESASAVDAGTSVNFTLVVANATPVDSVSWGGLPTGCTTANVSELVCRPNASGTYQVRANVSDPFLGTTESNLVRLTVDPALGSVAIGASRSVADVGQNVSLWANETGGFGSYTVQWYGLPTSCPSSTGSPLTCPLAAPGVYSLSAVLNDSLGGAANVTGFALIVDALPTIDALSPTRATLDVGQEVWINASATVPAGGANWTWLGLPSGCVGGNGPSVACRPLGPGASSASVLVTDANGGRSLGSPAVALAVSAALQVGGTSAEPTESRTGTPVEIRA
ncbi:MAG: hypothetical protein L3K05_00885, partial [Thermoplasmata archaeon]|nr:hypothetical protein [Thermoplasmata archaeon]